MKTILFVCSGNTCRSPLAEAVARDWFAKLPLDDKEDVFVASAGVWATDGAPSTPETIEALRRVNIEFSGHSKPLTAEMVRKADLVLCMTSAHAEAVRSLVEDDQNLTTIIETLDTKEDIDDPIGQGQKAYDTLVSHFQELIPKRIKETLLNENRAGV